MDPALLPRVAKLCICCWKIRHRTKGCREGNNTWLIGEPTPFSFKALRCGRLIDTTFFVIDFLRICSSCWLLHLEVTFGSTQMDHCNRDNDAFRSLHGFFGKHFLS